MPTIVQAPIRDLKFCAPGYYFAFQTDFNPATHGTFDPTIIYTGAGTPLWIFENGEVLTGASISTSGATQGLNGAVQTVILIVEEPENVTGIDFNSDRIYGTFAIPADFSALSSVRLDTNPTLTDVTFGGNTATWSLFWAYSCNITGVIDLSGNVNMGGNLQLQSNSGLTGITFPSASPTLWTNIQANNCKLSSLNISNCVLNSTSIVQVNSNANLTSFTRAASVTLNQLYLNSCKLSTFSFTGITFAGTSPGFQINSQVSNALTSITGGPSGSLNLFRIDGNALLTSPSQLDMSGVTWSGSNAYFNMEATGFSTVNHGTSTGTIRTYIFGQSAQHSYWSLGSLTISSTSLIFTFTGAYGMSAGNVNNWLNQLDGKLGAGTGTISLTGSTPAPTGSGLIAKTSLQGKGYTVNTN